MSASLKETALQFHAWGANVNAIKPGSKAPGHKWAAWYTERQTVDDVKQLPWHNAAGLGVIDGISDWRDIDLDQCTSEQALRVALSAMHLPDNYAWVRRSGSHEGYAVTVRCSDVLPAGVLTAKTDDPGVFWGMSKKGMDFHHVELRWERCQTIYPPSAYTFGKGERKGQPGPGYEWLNDAPAEPPVPVSMGDILNAFFSIATPGRDEPKPEEQAAAVVQPAASTSSPARSDIEKIKANFDLVAYAKQHYGNETQKEPNGEIRILGNGGLIIDPKKRLWDRFDEVIGGDCFDLVGTVTFENRWDRTDGAMFIKARNIAAEYAGVTLTKVDPLYDEHGGAKCPYCPLYLSRNRAQTGYYCNSPKHTFFWWDGEGYTPPEGLTDMGIYVRNKAISKGEQGAAESPHSSRLIAADDLHTLPPTRYLIQGILATNMLHQLFAPGGTGKSFIALDMALCVAQYAPVVYLAGEAIEAYKDRVDAWKFHHKKNASNLMFWNGPVKLADPMDVQAFIAEVQAVRPALIVVDTLATCMVGLEESSTGDMTIAVDSLNSIRKATAAGVLVVHHTGWAEDHERGNSTLRAACRLVMKLTNSDGLIKLSSAKQNNGAEFEPRCFRLLQTPIGTDNTPVPVPARDVIQIDNKLTQKQIAVLQTLSMAQFRDGASHTQICEDTTLGKSTVNRAINILLTRRLIEASEGRNKVYSILPAGDEELEYAAAREAVTVDFGSSGGVNWVINLEALVPEDAEQARNKRGTSAAGEATYTVPSSAVVPLLQVQVPPSSEVVPPDPELLVPCSVPSPPLRGDWMEQQPETDDDADDGRLIKTIREDIQHSRFPLARSVMRMISDPIRRTALEQEIDRAEHADLPADAQTVAAPVVMEATDAEQDDLNLITRANVLIDKGRLDLALQRVNQLASPTLKAEWQQKIHDAQSVGAA